MKVKGQRWGRDRGKRAFNEEWSAFAFGKGVGIFQGGYIGKEGKDVVMVVCRCMRSYSLGRSLLLKQ